MIVSFQKLLYIRYRYLYRCSSALAAEDIKLAVAHHIKPLTDIVKRDVRLVVVHHNYVWALVALSGCQKQHIDVRAQDFGYTRDHHGAGRRLPDSHRATVERVTYIFSANAC